MICFAPTLNLIVQGTIKSLAISIRKPPIEEECSEKMITFHYTIDMDVDVNFDVMQRQLVTIGE